jgi:hypothetical protein
MSALGTKLSFDDVRSMSAIAGNPDIRLMAPKVRD